MSFWFASAILLAAQPAVSQPADAGGDMVVTGARPLPQPNGRVEAPYSETQRVPLGSRIARRVSERPFETIASDSGVAGLVAGSGMDGTGGTTALLTSRRVTRCVAEDREVREEIACMLFRAQRATEVGELADARAALSPWLGRRAMNDAESYQVGRMAFTLAEAEADDGLRADALRLLLASGRLPEGDRASAERRLAILTAAGR